MSVPEAFTPAYYGAETHIDGMITNAAPQEVQKGTPEEIYARYFASGPKGDLGRSPDVSEPYALEAEFSLR